MLGVSEEVAISFDEDSEDHSTLSRINGHHLLQTPHAPLGPHVPGSAHTPRAANTGTTSPPLASRPTSAPAITAAAIAAEATISSESIEYSDDLVHTSIEEVADEVVDAESSASRLRRKCRRSKTTLDDRVVTASIDSPVLQVRRLKLKRRRLGTRKTLWTALRNKTRLLLRLLQLWFLLPSLPRPPKMWMKSLRRCQKLQLQMKSQRKICKWLPVAPQ